MGQLLLKRDGKGSVEKSKSSESEDMHLAVCKRLGNVERAKANGLALRELMFLGLLPYTTQF